TLSTLLLPPLLLLKTLDLLIILAHYYSTIICLTGKQLFGLSASHPLADLSINPLVSRFQFSCPRHCTVNKHFTVKLCLLNCFLHVGQIH
ncbi:hypothetical protein AMECASPLE_039141, partial [Ameca splendens]